MSKKRTLHRPRRIPGGRRAAAALEFALLGPILLLFLGGAADFGLAIYSRSRLAAAVSAGAEYAILNGRAIAPSDFSTFASTVKTVVSKVSGLSLASGQPTVAVGTYCVEGTPPALVASSSTCTNGSSPGVYAIINVSFSSPLFLPLGSITSALAVSQSASVQLQ